MSGLNRERGSVSIIVAILLVFLAGGMAISVEVGQMWADKARTQNAADTAAIAIASACAMGDCGTPAEVVAQHAQANDVTRAFVSDQTANAVAVIAESTQRHPFGSILGQQQSTVRSAAVANWGPLASAATFPLAISECAFTAQVGANTGVPPATTTEYVLPLGGSACTASGGSVPAGFRYLTSDSTCRVNSAAGGNIFATTTTSCGLTNRQGSTLIVPIFAATTATDTYKVVGYAGFQITGWCTSADSYNPSGTCSASNQHIKGRFVKAVSLQNGNTSDSVPNMGALAVRLALTPDGAA